MTSPMGTAYSTFDAARRSPRATAVRSGFCSTSRASTARPSESSTALPE